MKTIKLKILIVFVFCSALINNHLSAQSLMSKKIEIELLGSANKLIHEEKPLNYYLYNADINVSYKLNSVVSLGGYWGMGNYKNTEFYWIEDNGYSVSGIGYRPSHVYFYGLSGKLHFLPLITKRKTKFDIYTKAKVGITSFNSFENSYIIPVSGNYFDATINGGFSFYFTDYFGVSVEAGYRFLEFYTGTNLRGGLLVRF